jgi:hypothetical protein
MSNTLPPPADSERFSWLERENDDFPYYRDRPVAIGGGQWLLVMVAVLAGFAILIFPPPFLRGPVSGLIPVILLFAIPLAALSFVAPHGWTAIFRRMKGRDFLWMIAFAILNLITTFIMGAVIIAVTETTRNAGVAGLAEQSGLDRIMFFVRSVPQLFGEEVFSILPFLALLWLFTKRGMSRKGAIVLAWLLVAVLFAAAHLPTYGYNVIQALGGVGVARLILMLPYIMTKNIWVSTGTHILFDWLSFGMSIVGGSVAAGAE